MASSESDVDDDIDDIEPIEQLASEITSQMRRGQRPSSSELEAKFPELSEDVQGWVHTL